MTEQVDPLVAEIEPILAEYWMERATAAEARLADALKALEKALKLVGKIIGEKISANDVFQEYDAVCATLSRLTAGEKKGGSDA